MSGWPLLLWALAAALVLPPLLHRLDRAPSWSRTAAAWAAPAVAVAAAAVVTYDEASVTGSELLAATESAAYPLDGRLGSTQSLENVSAVALEAAVEDALGHEVSLTHGRVGEVGAAERTYAYEVTPRGGGDGPVVCVTVREFAVEGDLRAPGLSQAAVRVDRGRCAGR